MNRKLVLDLDASELPQHYRNYGAASVSIKAYGEVKDHIVSTAGHWLVYKVNVMDKQEVKFIKVN